MKKEFCYNCNKMVPIEKENILHRITVKGLPISFKIKESVCGNCGSLLGIGKECNNILKTAHKIFRDITGITNKEYKKLINTFACPSCHIKTMIYYDKNKVKCLCCNEIYNAEEARKEYERVENPPLYALTHMINGNKIVVFCSMSKHRIQNLHEELNYSNEYFIEEIMTDEYVPDLLDNKAIFSIKKY